MQKQIVGWCIIPANILANDDLTLSEKVLFGRILGLSDKGGYCFASNAWLGKQIGLSKGTVANLLSNLSSKGLIKIEIVRDENNQVKERRIYPIHSTVNTYSRNNEEGYSLNNEDSNRDKSNREENIYSRAVGFEKISNTLSYKKKNKNNNIQEWQDFAVRLWQGIGLKNSPSSSFFKLVKKAFDTGKKGLLQSAFAFVADAGADDPEKLFYWKFNQLLKNETK